VQSNSANEGSEGGSDVGVAGIEKCMMTLMAVGR